MCVSDFYTKVPAQQWYDVILIPPENVDKDLFCQENEHELRDENEAVLNRSIYLALGRVLILNLVKQNFA